MVGGVGGVGGVGVARIPRNARQGGMKDLDGFEYFPQYVVPCAAATLRTSRVPAPLVAAPCTKLLAHRRRESVDEFRLKERSRFLGEARMRRLQQLCARTSFSAVLSSKRCW